MTGFGRGTASRDGWEVVVQVNSVNRKGLEVVVALPREWQLQEAELVALVRGQVSRGRVQVAIEVRGVAALAPSWNDAAVDAILDRLSALVNRRGVRPDFSPELLYRVASDSAAQSSSHPAEEVPVLIREALAAALRELVESRNREGANLARDMAARTGTLRELAASIARAASATVPAYREVLLQRLRQAGLDLDLSDERVLKEIALFADRIDISEELTRLDSHLDHLGSLNGMDEPMGRKAEFILQEIGREIHTIGSKANDIAVARHVIEFKNELERIREQVQNVE